MAVWMVWGGCLEDVGRLNIVGVCLDGMVRLSGGCVESVRRVWGNCLDVVGRLSEEVG